MWIIDSLVPLICWLTSFETFLLAEIKKNYKALLKSIKSKLALDVALEKELQNAISEIKKKFLEGVN